MCKVEFGTIKKRTSSILVVVFCVCALPLLFGGCNKKRKSRFAEDHRDDSTKQTTATISSGTKSKKNSSTPVPEASDQLEKMAVASTVRLIVEPEKDSGAGFGSGVVVGRDDEDAVYVLTVWHAAKPGIRCVEFFSPQSHEPVRCTQMEVISKSERRDLALLRVEVSEPVDFQVAKIASVAKNPSYGYSVGCSSGRAPTVLGEHILGHDTIHPAGSDMRAKMWRTNKPQAQGRSGGALLDENGELLGIAVMATDQSGFYCHSDEIREYLGNGSLKKHVIAQAKLAGRKTN